jgi:hypothetical protein
MARTIDEFAWLVNGTRVFLPAGSFLGEFRHWTDEAGVRHCDRVLLEKPATFEVWVEPEALLAQVNKARTSQSGRSRDGAVSIRRSL